MSEQNALLSILMPAYNVGKFISDSIKSILCQEYQNFELIVIDDCSCDNTIQEVKKFKDKRIKLLKNSKNLGVAVTRNKLLSNANGEYIAFLDGDDICHKNRFTDQLNFLKRNPDLGLVGSKIKYITEDGHRIWPRIGDSVCDWKDVKAQLLFNNVISTSTVTFRKDILDFMDNNEVHNIAEDYFMWSKLTIQDVRIGVLNKTLVSYRVRESGSTALHSHRLKISFDLIHRGLLANLGIEITQHVLDIHNFLLTPDVDFDLELLTSSSAHYQRILYANSNLKIYPALNLLASIRKNWYIKCKRASKYIGFKAICIYISKFDHHNTSTYFRAFFLLLYLSFYNLKTIKSKVAQRYLIF